MRRLAAFVGIGLLVGVLAYLASYHLLSSPMRALAGEKTPELGWLKQEFNLSDTEFARISALHAAYQPHCEEMCRRIDAKNAEIKAALEKAAGPTPEIDQKLAEAAQLRAECQQAMLRHFFEVSHTMPPEQGRRYLAWVEAKTLFGMPPMSSPSSAAPHDH